MRCVGWWVCVGWVMGDEKLRVHVSFGSEQP